MCLGDIVRIAGYISVYQGSSLYNEDSNLTVFTTYVYRVTVFNRVGQSTSADSNEVTTFGGFPRKAPIVSASALSHQEILVAWTIPGFSYLTIMNYYSLLCTELFACLLIECVALSLFRKTSFIQLNSLFSDLIAKTFTIMQTQLRNVRNLYTLLTIM